MKKYNIIYADPPWDVKRGPDWNSNGPSKPLPYPTMSIDEIKALPVKEIADKNAHLYLWGINKYIPELYEVAKAWGFKPTCLLTWIKPPHGIGIGGTYAPVKPVTRLRPGYYSSGKNLTAPKRQRRSDGHSYATTGGMTWDTLGKYRYGSRLNGAAENTATRNFGAVKAGSRQRGTFSRRSAKDTDA